MATAEIGEFNMTIPASRRGAEGRRSLPDGVREKELEYIRQRRKAAGGRTDEVNSSLVGIALSGGGIRSAIFSLGFLQGMARHGILKLADYLSTVSGGGYLGACLTSLMTVTVAETVKESEEFSWTTKKREFDLGERMPFLEADQIHHFRRHADFLVMRSGLSRRETLRAVGQSLLGVAVTVSLFSSLLVILIGLVFLYGILFGGLDLWSDLGKTFPWQGWAAAVHYIMPDRWSALVLLASGFLAGGLLIPYCLKVPVRAPLPSGGETREHRISRRVLLRYAGWLSGTVVVLGWLAQWYLNASVAGTVSLSFLLMPMLGFAGAAAAGSVYFVLLGRLESLGNWDSHHRSDLSGMLGICVYLGLLSVAVVGVILAIWWLKAATMGLSIWCLVMLVVLRLLIGIDGTLIRAPRSSRWLRAVWRWAPPLAVPVFLFAVVVLGAHLVLKLPGIPGWDGVVLLFLVPLGGLMLWGVGSLIDFNRVAPHYYYRDRLAKMFLCTEQRHALRGLQVARDDSELTIHQMLDRFDRAGTDYHPIPNPAPYHLIQCSLDIPGSEEPARRHLKSDPFIFSRFFCGSNITGYVPSHLYREGRTKLSRAMAISGAAASGGLEYPSSIFLGFGAVLFNLRPGYWMENPKCYGNDTIYPEHTRPPKSARTLAHPSENRLFWPLYLWRELTAQVDADRPYVHLSHGGHTGDNLGLYPLLQRRCRLIVACDAEYDPDYTCQSLTAAIRQIYIDENVRIDIRLAARPTGKFPMHPGDAIRVGRILYPHSNGKSRRKEAEDSGEPSEGWLVYVKSSLVHPAPPAVQSYAARKPDFPHPMSEDRRFDDDQFEAFRVLGSFFADTCLNQVKESDFRGDMADNDRNAFELLLKWCRGKYEAQREAD